MITRISKIHGHRIFGDFSWPANLPEFGRFNLIYGWNASGKTTLSNLLRFLEKKEPILEGTVDFQIDGRICSGSTLATASVPRIRVFNQDYRDDTVFATVQQLKPIFFLGKDSVDKQKRIEELNKTKVNEQKKLEEKNNTKAKAIKGLDDFCIREAKAIKELLSSSGENRYNNYDKAYFRGTCARLAQSDPPPSLPTEEIKKRLKQQILEKPRDAISKIDLRVADFEQFRQTVEKLLQRTVLSQVIDELSADPAIAEWVREGIGHHTGKKHSDKCRFCDSEMPDGRIAKLQAHFNDEYNRFLAELGTVSSEITKSRENLVKLQLPAKAEFYDHLSYDYVKAAAAFAELVERSEAYLAKLSEAISEKRNKPFERITLGTLLSKTPTERSGAELLDAVNSVIDRHNTETSNFEKVVADARKALEEALVSEALTEFKEKNKTIQIAEEELKGLTAAIRQLGDTIGTLEKDVLEHRRPADELSAELRSYLGRDDLTFDVLGNGYRICRNGIAAENLSEGERTAIALLYFLKSLQDKAFDIAHDVIVIDDPVSSLDANSLFCAFGYIKARTKDAGQLFILTHNFPFFRQAKNWFHHLPRAQRPARFYMVEAGLASGKRNASLKELDRLLHEFESEYHYLFKQVFEQSNSDGVQRGLEEFYPMPNMARRVLEAFLSFRYPTHTGQLEKQVEFVQFDPAKKARILRFLHTYSHDGKISEPEHDLSILAETPEVLKDVLEMIKAEDPKHYDEMIKLVSPSPAAL